MVREKKFDKLAYDNKFHKENYTTITLRFRKGTDDDVLDMITSQENRTEYIRRLVLKDIKGE